MVGREQLSTKEEGLSVRTRALRLIALARRRWREWWSEWTYYW
jgi:hypothetical protein